MDEKLHRIIQFLRKNNNHYFETSDIAYHLKLDELYTNDALIYLSKNQLVTMSNDPQGATVWYAAEHWNQAASDNIPERQQFTAAEKNVFNEGSKKNHGNHDLMENLEKDRKPFPLGLFIVSVGIILLIGLSMYFGKRYVDTKFDMLMIRINESVTKPEFEVFSKKTIYNDEKLSLKMGELAGRMDSTNRMFDSLRVKDSLILKQVTDLKRHFRRR